MMNPAKGSALLVAGSVVLLALIMEVSSKKGDQHGYKTTYACEGKTLNIVCDDGVIHLIRANYGRFSISICNDHGNLDWQVNCMSHHSFLIMQMRCNMKPNCSISVSSATFQDPCPGTRKYLEVQYHCGSEMPVITPPTSSHPPFQKSSNGSASHHEEKTPIFTPPSVTTSTAIAVRFPAVVTMKQPTSTRRSIPIPTPPSLVVNRTHSVTSTTMKVTRFNLPKVPHTLPVPTKSTPVVTSVVYSTDYYCPPTVARGINWTWTKAGETAVMKCPDGASGFADWHCGINPVIWTPYAPNLQECRSLWLENIKRRMDQGDSIISVTTELALTSFAKPLFSKDLKHIGELIQQALHKGVKSMENVLDMWHRYNVLRELLQSLVKTLNNLLDEKQQTAWSDLSPSEQKSAVSSLLEALEKSALLLAETSSADGSFSLVKSNILLSLQVLNLKAPSIQFPNAEDVYSDANSIYWSAMNDRIFLPAKAVQEYVQHGLVKVVFIAYRNVNELLKPGPNIIDYPRDDHSDNITRIVNSQIIAASLERVGNPKLMKPVTITLKHLLVENATNPICVYWDFHFRDWSARGCWVEMSNRTHTVCACDHLTNFAVIMELKSAVVTGPELEILRIVIPAGCIVAVICLFLTVAVLCTLRVSSDWIVVQKNMFICLLVAEAVFVAGIDQTRDHITCAIIAGALQYFFLASFCWMFFECYQQYVTLVSSSDPEKSQAKFYYAAAYILPAVIVGVSAVIDPSSYGTDEYCWLHADNYFIFSFVGPAVGIVFGGIVFLCITICIFCHRASVPTAVKGKEEAKLSSIKSFSGRSIILVVSVILTWTSGLLYINKGSTFLAYSFSILNILLGTTILALYCLRNDKPGRKEQETQSAALPGPNRTPSGDHIPQQLWGPSKSSSFKRSVQEEHSLMEFLPAGKRRALEQSTSGHSTAAANHEEETSVKGPDDDSTLDGKSWDVVTAARWKLQNTSHGSSYTQEHEKNSKLSSASHAAMYRQHCNTFPASGDPNTQFSDHIYESIDDDDFETDPKEKQFPPAENYYGDHSDLSQHSSSSYGYDQRPLLIGTSQPRHASSSQAYCTREYDGSQEMEEKSCRNMSFDHGHKINRECKMHTGVTSRKKSYNSLAGNTMPSGQRHPLKSYYPETTGNSLPDLLQCPADSSSVLAVLEGDKVVSHLQQEDMQNQPQKCKKTSAYC